MARWSLPVDTNEDPRHSENKQYQIVPIHQLFPRCSNSMPEYTRVSFQLLRGALSTRGFGENTQTVLISFLAVE